ncbi:Golgi-associated plant pathogenesis-related protein 1-like [Dermacentor andersoni]|uniref:Golgi-associated plant pathogenesis-related protein 1-like n=1 Tax=Dermacentor andersoni TaxID=34620 RepID=UPI0024165012|nr:Golgi-associated plant pathogenesis-related protein 1-like [Dermacentor andersoni]
MGDFLRRVADTLTWCCTCRRPPATGLRDDDFPTTTIFKTVSYDDHGRRIVATKTVQSSMLRKKIINHSDGTKDIVEEIITPGSQTMLSRDRPLTEAEFQKDSLDWHNYYRSLHGVPALQLDAKLSAMAKTWAITLAKEDRFEHSPDTECGENVYVKWSSNPKHQITGREAVESWYSEISEYRWDGTDPDIDAVGHFTQVIWKETTRMGCAQARGPTNKILVVANYSPPGNVVGKFATCVPPLQYSAA